MIYYIYNSTHGGMIEPGSIIAGRSAFGVAKKLCQKHLFSYDGYIQSVQMNLSIKRKIPIVITNDLVFFSTQAVESFENIFVNYMMIEKVEYKGEYITLFFDEKYQLSVKLTKTAYLRNQTKIKQIINYKRSLV